MTIKKFFESAEKLAIHCDTKEQADRLLEEFDKLGYKWKSGFRYIYFEQWDTYNKRTCFDNKNHYGPIDFYEANNYTILEFKDIDDFKEVSMSNTVKIGGFREKLDNVSKAIENLKKEFEILKENNNPECGLETFCGLPVEEAKRIIQLYTLTKKEPVTDWATYIHGFENGAKMDLGRSKG